MKRFKQVLSCEKGQGYPLVVAMALAFMLSVTVISQYFHYYIVAQGVRDALQDAAIVTVTENYADVYHGVREGYSGGYQPSAESFNAAVNYGDIYSRMSAVLGTSFSGGAYVKTINGEEEFRIYDLDVVISNATFAQSDTAGDRFVVESTIVLEIPISFCGNLLPNLRINIRTTAGYTPIF
ncbi:MAG: hypothetical protein R3Y63_09460 [Eubacteriales bacterium]